MAKRVPVSCLKGFAAALALLALASPAWAGPPYLSDDPQPTDFGHYEIYAFGLGTSGVNGMEGEAGIDFNYGAAPDLQLTAVVPMAYDGEGHKGLGNIELAAKYRFLHQDEDGIDLSVFPRAFLPSASRDVGDQHASFLLPLWAEKDFGAWSLFGGGGCVLNRSGDDRNFCLGGMALTRTVTSDLHLGLEVFRQTADAVDSKASTLLGAGLTYDLSEHYHLLAYWGPSLQNVQQTGRSDWYSALLFTF
jgi:Putative MetA-pathway of phenol degradation